MAFLDQVGYEPSDIKRRILWFLFGVFLFCSFQVCESLMSSKMTVESSVSQVETLEDIVSKEFEYIVPRFTPQFGMMNVFDQEPIGSTSIYRRIYDKALEARKRGEQPFLHISTGSVSSFSQLLKDTVQSGNSAFLQPSYIMRNFLTVLCVANSSVEVHIGHETYRSFADGFIYSKSLNFETRNHLDHRLRRLLEGSSYQTSDSRQITEAVLAFFVGGMTQPVINCIDMIEIKPDEEVTPVSFNAIQRSCWLYSGALAIGLMALMTEISAHRSCQWYKSLFNKLYPKWRMRTILFMNVYLRQNGKRQRHL